MSIFRDFNFIGVNPNLGNRGLNKKDISNKIFCYLSTTSITTLTPTPTNTSTNNTTNTNTNPNS
ncbi:hypothetical protein, partial [Clostridium sp.]|uniref:hypothetical protein n=1 Tax=Clostridium sp. TaxID=1506 RepID=UPI0034643529